MFEDEDIEDYNSRASFTQRLRSSIQVGLLSAAIEGDEAKTVGDTVDRVFDEVMKLFDGVVEKATRKETND